jgi:hypothetical protein
MIDADELREKTLKAIEEKKKATRAANITAPGPFSKLPTDFPKLNEVIRQMEERKPTKSGGGGSGGVGGVKSMKYEPVKYAKGGKVGSASKRADGIAQRGKTRGRMV